MRACFGWILAAALLLAAWACASLRQWPFTNEQPQPAVAVNEQGHEHGGQRLAAAVGRQGRQQLALAEVAGKASASQGRGGREHQPVPACP